MRGYRRFSEMDAHGTQQIIIIDIDIDIDIIVMSVASLGLTFVQSKFKFQISLIFTDEPWLNNNKQPFICELTFSHTFLSIPSKPSTHTHTHSAYTRLRILKVCRNDSTFISIRKCIVMKSDFFSKILCMQFQSFKAII